MNMKIQIVTNSPTIVDKYITKLFNLLEEDKNFEKLIVGVKKQLNIDTPLLKRKIEPFILKNKNHIKLRSESPKSLESGRYLDNPKVKHGESILEKPFNKIISEYPYIAEWKEGLFDFLVTNEFTINEDEPIKLRIKTSGRSYFGHYTDRGEEGVKILLTSIVTAKQLNKWFIKNKDEIDSFIQKMKSTSKEKPKQSFYFRNLLIAYMKEKLGYSFSKIDKEIGDNSGAKAMELAYDDYRKQTS